MSKLANLWGTWFLFLSLWMSASGLVDQLQLKECMEVNQETGHIGSISITPYPIVLPGNLTVSGSVQLFRPVSGNITVKVDIRRKLGFLGYAVSIPCIKNVGTCTYTDACSLIQGLDKHTHITTPAPTTTVPTASSTAPTDSTAAPTSAHVPADTTVPASSALPTGTPISTSSMVPTDTPVPVSARVPTDTPVPTSSTVPTGTPVPTGTRVPTDTTVPTSAKIPTDKPVPNTPTVATSTPSPISTATVAATTQDSAARVTSDDTSRPHGVNVIDTSGTLVGRRDVEPVLVSDDETAEPMNTPLQSAASRRIRGDSCPRILADNNIPCSCPFHAGVFSIPPTTFSIPDLGAFNSLAQGDYKVHVSFFDGVTEEMLMCQTVELSITQPHKECSGLGCIIG